MTITHNAADTRMTSSRSGEVAIKVGDDAWRVSWLSGTWTRNQATTALAIAELAAVPDPADRVVRAICGFLTELGLDRSALDRLGGGV